MSNVFSRGVTLFVVFGALTIGACESPSLPSAIQPTQGEALGQSSATDLSSGSPNVSMLSQAVTDVTLADAGWACIQPGNGLVLCAPPGTGLPPLPPTGNGAPSYNIMAFTLAHEFVHHVKLLRPDIYNDQPCLGGDRWTYVPVIQYYECIIPGSAK